MACNIGLRMNYKLYRRVAQGSQLEVAVFEPELFVIMIFGRPVFSIYTNSENLANTWFSLYNGDRRRKRVVGLHFQLLQPLPACPHPPVASIQICVNGGVFIYHMYCASDLPIALQQFMDDPNNTFFGVNSRREWQLFRRSTLYNGNIAYRSLGTLAALHFGRAELLNADLAQLALTILGEEQLTLNDEGEEFTMQEVDLDWDKHTLSDEQVMYAVISAYLSYELGRALVPHINS